MDSNRRSFLKGLGLGAASLAACERLPVRHAIPYLVPPEEITPGIPAFYASTCTACPAGCGLMVKVLDGRPVKLEGNREHPLSRGGLCPSGQAWLRSLYDPTRLKGPTVDERAVAWSELDAHVKEGLARAKAEGRELAVVSRTIVSPSARRAIEGLLALYPGRLVEHELDSRTPSALLEAYELTIGEARAPALLLENADLLVSFGADLFGGGPEPVAHTAGWAESRRRGRARHVQIEGGLSLTGAAADERITATSSERRAMALELLRLVAEETDSAEAVSALRSLRRAPSGQEVPRASELASELLRARGRSLVVSGANDLGEQLAVALTNRLLANEGRTLDLASASRTRAGLDRDLSEVVDRILDGRVGALVVLGLDLVSFLPGGDAIGTAMAGLPLSVAISDRASATTAACRAVAAAHHGLECWADVEPRSGLVTLAQPTVRPLFETRHPHENFLHWSGAARTDYLRFLMRSHGGRRTWNGLVRSAGLASDRTAPPAPEPRELDDALGALEREASRRGEAPEVELELARGHGLRSEGDFENPWLRELPDPLTRVAWSPVARVSPELARERGIQNGDVLEITNAQGTGAVSLPAFILPGQHPRVVGLPLGYVEASSENAARLGVLDRGKLMLTGLDAGLERTGRRAALPLLQTQDTTEGRPTVHQVARRGEAVHAPHHPEASLWDEREKRSPHWEMVIDLDACTGCSACAVACQAENNLPVVGPEEITRHRDMYWLRIDRYFVGDGDTPDVLFEPMLCAQCDDAPCETVCPVAATVHSEDGLNQQVYNRCVGTRYCANNCPYKVRRFNWFDMEPVDPIERLVLNPDVVVRSRGVMEKCTFCVQRIQGARIAARREGRESFAVEPACAQSCPAQAIRFGDGADPESEVTRLGKEPRGFQVLAELGIRPSVTYLARVRNRERAEGDNHGD